MVGRVRVVNVRGRAKHPNDVYVGRPSPLGNPYTMRDESERITVCDAFRTYIASEMRNGTPHIVDAVMFIVNRLLAGQDVNLGCFCVPLMCHANHIKELVEVLADEFSEEKKQQVDAEAIIDKWLADFGL